MKPHLLVTGAAGFIGANFVNRLVQEYGVLDDYGFVVLDALTYAGDKSSLDEAIKSGVIFVHGNICDKRLLGELFEKYAFSGVINFAAESHVDRSIEGPSIFLETNVGGVLCLLEASLQKWKQDQNFKFLQVSTDEVYGTLQLGDAAFTEKHSLQPNSPYSASKASGDHFVRAYQETFGLPTLITRCSNNYGPLQFREKLIPLMITRALENKPLPVYGKGDNRRDWIFVDDHNDGIWDVFNKGKPGEVYNLGGAAELPNLQVVKTILKLVDRPDSLIEFVTDRPGHDFRYAIDFSKAQNELGWSPKVNFEKGLERTVAWYLNHREWRNK